MRSAHRTNIEELKRRKKQLKAVKFFFISEHFRMKEFLQLLYVGKVIILVYTLEIMSIIKKNYYLN